MDSPTTLPATFHMENAESAQLPQRYEAARTAIAECDRIDECKTWSDKAAALASYARQAKDDSLAIYARRIQARALRRAGELIKQIEPARGANQNIQDGAVPKVTRESAARDAGLSERQRKTALRVATVPGGDFDYAIESQDPPTVSKLAALGTQSRPAPIDNPRQVIPADRSEVLEALKAVAEFCQFCDRVDPVRVAVALGWEIAQTSRAEVAVIDGWLDRLVANLPS
jgi:hypothetical protein